MQNVWNLVQLISVSLGFVLLFLLFLLNKKFENPLFKYSLFLQTAAQVFFTFDLVSKSFNLAYHAHEVTIITYHFLQLVTVWCWIVWGHKITSTPFSPLSRVTKVLASLTVLGGLAVNLMRHSDNRVFIFMSVVMTLLYVNFLIERNIENLSIKKTVPHFKIYTRLTTVILIPAIIIPGAAQTFPEAAAIHESIDFSILLFVAVNVVILTSVTIIFFSPNPTGAADIPQEFTVLYNLTSAEAELTNLVIKGYTVNAISRTVNLSPQTVKNYTSLLYRKLNIKNRIELMNLVNGCAIAN